MSSVKLLNISIYKNLFQNTLKQINPSLTKCEFSSEPSWVPEDPKTHTGQHWEKDDYRLARFIDRPKQINKQFAIDLIAKVPPKACKERVVWCDGGDEHTGHPRVYINLDKPGNHACGYCGLRFYLETSHH